MSILSRVEKHEDAILRHGGDPGYKLVMVEADETPEEAITRSGLTDWPAERILLISFVKAYYKLPRTN